MKGWGSADIGSENFHILMMTQEEVYKLGTEPFGFTFAYVGISWFSLHACHEFATYRKWKLYWIAFI